jgi:hypothetical protein
MLTKGVPIHSMHRGEKKEEARSATLQAEKGFRNKDPKDL